MPPFTIKGTMFFFQGKQGWSESWILRPSSPNPDLGLYTAVLNSLAQLRMPMMGQDVTLDVLKVTDITQGVKRRVVVQPGGLQGSFSTKSANADAASLVRFYNANKQAYVLRPLRAVPQSVYAPNGPPVVNAEYQTALLGFKNALITPGWGWYSKGASTAASISAVANTPGSPTVVTVTGTPFTGIVPGTRIRVTISGVLGATELNGPQSAIVNTASSIQIPRATAIDPWTPGTGFVKVYAAPNFNTVADGGFERFDERKTGRPSYTSRGRRPALRRI